MVKLGFIAEGDTEKIIIESPAFQAWAQQHGIQICTPVLNANGSGNLLPKNLTPLVKQLQRATPAHIVILTDLEDEASEERVRQRIGEEHTKLIFIAVKAIEAWFLADSKALQAWLKTANAFEAAPEATAGLPWDRLKEIAANLNTRGTGGNKVAFAKKMVTHWGFSIANAAQHPACPSAKRFHDALITLGKPSN